MSCAWGIPSRQKEFECRDTSQPGTQEWGSELAMASGSASARPWGSAWDSTWVRLSGSVLEKPTGSASAMASAMPLGSALVRQLARAWAVQCKPWRRLSPQ
jgi:hypothetical protein